MVQIANQITFIGPKESLDTSKPFLKATCCICRREILENEIIKQCPKCQTYFHSKHLSIWLESKKSCPICHCNLYFVNSTFLRPYTKKITIKKSKFYRCYYCNHIWEARSSGHQLYCPSCGITSCPHCKTAFGIDFLLKALQMDSHCPKCNKYIVLESLKAKITALKF
ncbi:MAG: RING finger domain-containing protein [Promethearchaeota archaeon]